MTPPSESGAAAGVRVHRLTDRDVDRHQGAHAHAVDRGGRRPRRRPGYPVLTGDHTVGARWESRPVEVGRALAPPKPVFRKLDPSIVDEELARLGG